MAYSKEATSRKKAAQDQTPARKESDQTAKTGVAQRPAGKPETVSRGITEQPGELNGLPYSVVQIPVRFPQPQEDWAEFANNLQNGDLLIDKFGNEKGIVAKVSVITSSWFIKTLIPVTLNMTNIL